MAKTSDARRGFQRTQPRCSWRTRSREARTGRGTMPKLLAALAVACVALVSPHVQAAVIISHGAFTVEVTDPPQPTGPGFFEIRSPYFNPNVGPDEDPRPP